LAAVDTPPGIGLGTTARGWFAARPGPRRLAEIGLRITVVVGIVTVALAGRHPEAASAATLVVGALTCAALAVLGVAVRRAQVSIAADGVRWGWGRWVVRMERERLVRVEVFDDAIALVPQRGSTWFLSRRDWDRFERMRRAVVDAGLPVEDRARRAPFTARLQSYGRVLDALVVGAMVGAVVLALGAAAL